MNAGEQITQHLKELNSSIDALKRKGYDGAYINWDPYGQLMQAKSTALLALATLEVKEGTGGGSKISDLD